jgi:DNA (cytosine-5)-methyltransferase 1
MAGDSRYAFYEFFAGGGLARLGLGAGWRCDFANDIDPKKCAAYRANFGDDELVAGDVCTLSAGQLPGQADLAWASFPCQDLSLAGPRSGLSGARSGVFYGFWRLMEALQAEGRAPRLIGLENVTGLLSSKGGDDFTALCRSLSEGGYRFGAVEIDARWFLPQSRPRLFIIALRKDAPLPADLALETAPDRLSPFHTRAVRKAAEALPEALKADWVWWALPTPPIPNQSLADVLEPAGDVAWHTRAETRCFIDLMSETNRAKLKAAKADGAAKAGALYRRMRQEDGKKAQRAEVRFDGLAGCLRTPGGGSSRQFVMTVEGRSVRTRAMTPREYARLMGIPEDYQLPDNQNAALHLSGDGVAVSVVAFLRTHLFEPLLDKAGAVRAAAE